MWPGAEFVPRHRAQEQGVEYGQKWTSEMGLAGAGVHSLGAEI